jgi:iron complex outermembrane receptor protein
MPGPFGRNFSGPPTGEYGPITAETVPLTAFSCPSPPSQAKLRRMLRIFLCCLLLPAAVYPADSTLRGRVTMASNGEPLHDAEILIPSLRLRVETNEDGRYEVKIPRPGRYQVVAHMHNLTDMSQAVEIAAGAQVELDFAMRLAVVRSEITVTASGNEETLIDAVPSVTSIGSLQLQGKQSSTSLGDLLDDQAGVAKRSFGPGSSRPVIRGFDGDRVLVLQDGVRTGTLSSQSGDHGEPIDSATLERVEIVRGPATLLYGSNAIGGVVNTISNHMDTQQHPHDGLRGRVGGTGGTNNAQGGGAGSFEYGKNSWLFWGGGGGMRTGDYHAPIEGSGDGSDGATGGRILNSGSRLEHASAGIGRSGPNSFSFGYGFQDGLYGIPFASELHEDHDAKAQEIGDEDEHGEDIRIKFRRQNFRFNGAITDFGPWFEKFRVSLNYSDWHHRELEGEETGTEFFNKQFVYRGEFEQRRKGKLSGNLGFWGMTRNYKAEGEEALSPPVDQNAFALFALEQVNWERVRLQFGVRMEHNGYSVSPRELDATPHASHDHDGIEYRNRSFTGVSAGAGANFRLWSGGAFVANYTHSYRAPALEELYNFGPHLGNVTFEIGNPNLERERSDGLDLSLRHQSTRQRYELNWFYYGMRDFVYLANTGKEEDGLPVAVYEQANARYTGVDAKAQFALMDPLWLNLSFDYVNAKLTEDNDWLPRIPPLRGRVGLDYRYKNLLVRPELAMAWRQDRLAPNETETAGYAVPNITGTYTIARSHTLHVIGVNFFNASNRLYRNHLSFIKDRAPEIGRGIRFSYTLHIF